MAGLERITPRHDPPHPVQLQPLECGLGDMQVTGMGGIERAAKQANSLSAIGAVKIMCAGQRHGSGDLDLVTVLGHRSLA